MKLITELKIYTDKPLWLDDRKNHLTATEMAAAFGLSSWCTPYELHQRKAGKYDVAIEPNERMKWGIRLEKGISEGLAEDNGWQAENFSGKYYYISDPELRLGATIDNLVECPVRGPGIAEIKNIDFIQFKNDWNENSDEIPDAYELQLQTQLLLTDRKWGCLAALVGGNNLKVFIRERDDDVCQAIINKTREFWQRVADNNPPPIDFKRDYDILSKIYDKRDKSKIIELPDLETKLIRYQEITQQSNDLEAEKNEIKCLLLAQSDEASKVFSGTMQASIAHIDSTPDITFTRKMAEELIGTVKKGRSGYNRITINQRKI